MDESRIFVTGGNGQLGTALKKIFPGATYTDHQEFDITDEEAYARQDWTQYDVLINAAAMTNVDGAETPEGRELAWRLNASAVSFMSAAAQKYNLTLVHISSDYVFDGTRAPHREAESFTPLSVYGASKAAGDIAAELTPQHYILRTTWVIGQGKNFVRTMWELAHKGVAPSVVNDQIGRLTFADDLAAAIKHAITTHAPYGTYNLTNDGSVASWADFAKLVYEAAGKSADDVTGITTAEYYSGKEGIAPRPLQSEMDLSKIKSTAFSPRDWHEALDEYLQELKKETV